jgi:hypothetical protein
MHNEKSYFGTQNGSLAMCRIGVVTIEQYEPAQELVQHGRSTVNFYHGRAAKRYSSFVVRGCETFWNLQKNEGSVWGQLFESGNNVWMGGKISELKTKPEWETS